MADEKKDDHEKKKKLKQGESEEITKKATDEEKDFKTSNIEGTKDSSPQPPSRGGQNPKPVVSKVEPPEIVRGEDVVKILRAKGVKI